MSSSLENLPSDVIENELSRYLNKTDLSKLTNSSKTMASLFKAPLKVAKLLHFVTCANYVEAEKLIDENPRLMFQSIQLNSESISPLKYTFKVYDTYMWKMFLSKIQKNYRI